MTLDWDIEVFEDIPSTQDICKTRAQEGGAEGFVAQALIQSAGKGRRQREWVSGEGNLTFSFILRPRCDLQSIGQISILIGVALAKTIGVDARLKWPNDVLLSDGKCAGILIESELDGEGVNWLVVGVGVNTANAPDIGAVLNVERDQFLQALLVNIASSYQRWQDEGFEGIREEWLAHTYEKGTQLNVGAFESLDDFGNLIVREPQNQLKTISAGDVYLKDLDYAAGD